MEVVLSFLFLWLWISLFEKVLQNLKGIGLEKSLEDKKVLSYEKKKRISDIISDLITIHGEILL